MLLLQQISFLRNINRFFIFGLLLFLPSSLYCQFYNGSQLTFGKSRVQYTNFQWTYYRYDRFDVYFYLNGKELAMHTADYAKSCIPVMEKKLGATLDEKIQFVVYNTLGDLRQSNIGLMDDRHYNTGGITHIINNKVFLYFDGDMNNFDRQIRCGLARLAINQITYGQSISSQMRQNAMLNLPAWYVDGLVSYYGREWDTELENIVKDNILSGRYQKFNHLYGVDATYAGHSFWRFIAQKYGEENLANIVYIASVSRRIENGFLYVLGISYKTLQKEWEQWYKEEYAQQTAGNYGNLPGIRFKRDLVYNRLRISPDGEQIAFGTNDNGLFKVYLYNATTGKQKRIYKKGFRLDEKVDYSYPIIAWHPSGMSLAMILEMKGTVQLCFYDMETKHWRRQPLFGFQKVIDFDYSPDGRYLVMSAVQRGQSDIYLYNIISGLAEQLTRDIYNDLNPRFINGTSKIVFSSNRPTNILNLDRKEYQKNDGLETNDLFIYDLKTRSKILYRATETSLANELYPMSYAPGHFCYISDKNGIYNRYVAQFDSAIAYVDTATHYRYFVNSFPVTNYPRNILGQDVSFRGGKLGEVIYENNRYKFYVKDISPGDLTQGVNLQETNYSKLQESKQEQKALEAANEKVKNNRKKKQLTNVYTPDLPTAVKPASDTLIHLQARDELKSEAKDIAMQVQKASKQDSVPIRMRNYQVEFSINELISQLDFSYLNTTYQVFTGYGGPIFQNPGTGALFTMGATDLLEDFRLIGGVRLNFDFVNNEYLVGFADLRRRLDKELFIHRSSFDQPFIHIETGVTGIVRHRLIDAHYNVKYPFTEVLFVKGGIMLQQDKQSFMAQELLSLSIPDESTYWAALKGELTFDNTRSLGVNLYQGLRWKIFGEYYHSLNNGESGVKLQGLDLQDASIWIVGLDARHYTRIHRSFIWANRFAASTSLGKNKLIYYLGGVDSWISPRSGDAQVDYTKNYIFQTLATNMRGFPQNIRNGNTFAVFNTELRFPVFNYFFNRTLKNDFLNNFQVIGFADAGSAWYGLNPMSEENIRVTKEIFQDPFYITVESRRNPWVAGYGIGLRSSILGYFIRADWAWGVEDGSSLNKQFYFSVGVDF